MSDLADKASCVESAIAGGAMFARPKSQAPAPNSPLACPCGGRPSYGQHPSLAGSDPVEVLRCASCGRSVGPYKSRHMLREAWRLGWFAEGSTCAR